MPLELVPVVRSTRKNAGGSPAIQKSVPAVPISTAEGDDSRDLQIALPVSAGMIRAGALRHQANPAKRLAARLLPHGVSDDRVPRNEARPSRFVSSADRVAAVNASRVTRDQN